MVWLIRARQLFKKRFKFHRKKFLKKNLKCSFEHTFEEKFLANVNLNVQKTLSQIYTYKLRKYVLVVNFLTK